jgi:putative peptidoglycan lipid II flippase
VAASELPQMASETGSDEEVNRALRKRLDRGIRQVSFFVVPTTIAFLLIGRTIIAALYQRGEFTATTTLIVWYVLIGSTIGLLVSTISRLYSSAFYALHDTKTPFRIALARVALGGALALLFGFPLREMFGAMIRALHLPLPAHESGATVLGVVGITAASGIAAWLEFVLLRRGIHARVGRGEPKGAFFVRLWTAALAAGGAALAFHLLLAPRLVARLPLRQIAEAILVCGLFGVVYFAAAYLLGVPEVRATLGRFVKRA